MQRKPFHPWSLMATVKPEAVAGRTRGRPGSPASVCAPGIAPPAECKTVTMTTFLWLCYNTGLERSWECKYGPYAADSEWLDYVGGPGRAGGPTGAAGRDWPVTDVQQESGNLRTRATERWLLPTTTGPGRGLDPQMRPQPLQYPHLNPKRRWAEDPVTALPTHGNWGEARVWFRAAKFVAISFEH